MKLCENLSDRTRDNAIFTRAMHILVLLYRNFGEYEKARACANRMPEIGDCRELLLASAADGRDEAKYIGDALLKLAGDDVNFGIYHDKCRRDAADIVPYTERSV